MPVLIPKCIPQPYLSLMKELYERFSNHEILSIVSNQNQQLVDETLHYCISHMLITGSEFAHVFWISQPSYIEFTLTLLDKEIQSRRKANLIRRTKVACLPMWLDQKFYLMLKADKNLKEWAEMLGDELLATTILDMLLYKCVIIQLQGKSYRLENRKPLFKEK